MQEISFDDKVVEVFHLVPSLSPDDNDQPNLPTAAGQMNDQTYYLPPDLSETLLQPRLSPPLSTQDRFAISFESHQHKCNYCDASFADIDEIVLHQRRTHSRTTSVDQPTAVMCFICRKHFSSEIHLEFHMTADHRGCRPYRCEFCSRKYANLTSLDVHILEEHPNRHKPYTCTNCMASFSDKLKLIQHLNDGHQQKYVCQFCVRSFRNVSQLRRHEDTHTTQIIPAETKTIEHVSEIVLSLSYDTVESSIPRGKEVSCLEKKSVNLHSDISAPNVFPCSLCTETFSENGLQGTHILTHCEEGPFECPDCGNLYEDIEMFQEHMQTHDTAVGKPQPQPEVVMDNMDYDNLNHSIDTLLNNTESHDFDEEQDSNYDEIITNLRDFDSKEVNQNETNATTCHTNIKEHMKLTPDHNFFHMKYEPVKETTTTKVAFSMSSVFLSAEPNTQQITSSEPQSLEIYTKSNTDPLDVESTINKKPTAASQSNKRTPVSVEWQNKDKKVRNYNCKICNRSFTLASTLALHNRRTHLGIKPYECDSCGWRFAQSSDLIKHKRTHTGVKPFTCDYCKTSFSQKRNLVTHMKIHTTEPSICAYCGSTFLIDESLKQHLKKHTGPEAENCKECDIPYSNKKDMDIHVKRWHVQVNRCYMCNKEFTRSSDLKKHLLIHTGNLA